MTPTPLTPRIVAEWDGIHAWLQWEGKPGGRYRARVRFREPGAASPGKWTALTCVAGAVGCDCVKIGAINRPGWEVQAQVARAGSTKWETAKPALFNRAQCKFEIQSARKVTFAKGWTIHCIVGDWLTGALECAYEFLSGVEVQKGRTEVVLKAVRSGPGNRLRASGEFEIHPACDISIKNAAGSVDEFKAESPRRAIITIADPDGAMTVAFRRQTR